MESSSLLFVLLSSIAKGTSVYPVIHPPVFLYPSALQDNGCGSRWAHFPSYYSRNGVQDTTPVKDMNDCLNRCNSSSSCYAVDFQRNTTAGGGCWQHRKADDLRPSNTLGPDPNFAQFIKDRRCLRIPPLSESKNCQVIANKSTDHSSTGFSVHYYTYRAQKDCYELCLGMKPYNCVGYDFDNKLDRPSGGCHIFFDKGNLSMLFATPFVDHYEHGQLVCPATSTPPPTPSPVIRSSPARQGSAPKTTTPKTTSPKTTTPKTTTPKTTSPKTTAPKITTPKTTAPNTTAPNTTAPNTTAPNTTAPNTTTPTTITPNTTKPTTTKPTKANVTTETAVTSAPTGNLTTDSQKKKGPLLNIVIVVVIVIAIVIIVVLVVRRNSKKETQPKSDKETKLLAKKSDSKLNKGQIPLSSETGRRESGSRLSISRHSIQLHESPSEITPLKETRGGSRQKIASSKDNLKKKYSVVKAAVPPKKEGPSKKPGKE